MEENFPPVTGSGSTTKVYTQTQYRNLLFALARAEAAIDRQRKTTIICTFFIWAAALVLAVALVLPQAKEYFQW